MSKGVFMLGILEGIQLIKKAVVKIASPKKRFGMWVVNMRDRATSKRWRFFFSAMPFCWGVPTHELWCMITWSFR